MNYQQILSILSDLPGTFQRPGTVYQSILQSFTSACARNTIAIDALISQISLPTANWGWLDAVGNLFGIPRNPYEIDPSYRSRIQATLIAPHVTPTAMENFIQAVLGISVIISENFTNATYQLEFSSPVSTQDLQNIVNALIWVRPAGIPFLPIYTVSGGLFLNTVNFFGVKRVSGSYLVQSRTSVDINIAPNTDNPQAMLPTVYLTDPLITGIINPNSPYTPLIIGTMPETIANSG